MTDIGYWMQKQVKEIQDNYKREEEIEKARRRFKRRHPTDKEKQTMDTDCDASLANVQNDGTDEDDDGNEKAWLII